MNKPLRVIEICREEGIVSTISKINQYLTSLLRKNYYYLKSRAGLGEIVCINGIRIDTEGDIFTNKMTSQIRGGRYEFVEWNMIQSHIEPDLPVIDIGAGIGYTVCAIDRNLYDSVPIVCVEANKQIIPELHRTMQLNNMDVEVRQAAYHPFSDQVKFHVSKEFWESSTEIPEEASIHTKVPAVSLRELIDQYHIQLPVQLVVDIEGSERGLLSEELELLSEKCKILIIEFHKSDRFDLHKAKSDLKQHGLEKIDQKGNVHTYSNTKL